MTGKAFVKSWDMPSSTNPAKHYKVLMFVDGTFSCNCPRWTNKRPGLLRNCPHITALLAVLRLDQVDTEIASQPNIARNKRHIERVGDE